MVEPISAVGAAAVYVGHKLLGPSLDQLGSELRAASEQRAQNFGQIMKRALERGGPAPPGTGVHPRVLSEVLEQGSWSSDEVAQEYLAGLLISARSRRPDDRAFQYARAVTSLTSEQIRCHYAIYHALATRARGVNWNDGTLFHEHAVAAPLSAYEELMTVPDSETAEIAVFEVLSALTRVGLLEVISTGWNEESSSLLRTPVPGRFDEEPAIAAGTHLGVIVFLWAHGVVTIDSSRLGDIDWTRFPPIGTPFSRCAIAPTDGPEKVPFT